MKAMERFDEVDVAKRYQSAQNWNRALMNQVGQQLNLIERMNRLRSYLSPQVAETILGSEDYNPFQIHRSEITVVFLDLRGFTAFSNRADPEEVMAFLRNYHAEMGRLISKFQGTLEHFAGDGIMIFFNDPLPCEDHTERAVRMAVEMRARFREPCMRWIKKGYDLDLGIGLAAGCAVLGNIGFEGRMAYCAVGNVTNLASRLSSAARGGQILVDLNTLSKIEDRVEAESLGELHLKGYTRPVTAFNIVNLRQATRHRTES
ncbi:MAG: adenylate/guanylate cyclase domain-containing protein [Deltaproteobacteria bacterium]|nr:adenylate/guanylate cyclase domain-containing protein [Deltaproteobacteria bacterium]